MYRADSGCCQHGLAVDVQLSQHGDGGRPIDQLGKLIKATDHKIIVSRSQLDFRELRTVSTSKRVEWRKNCM